MSPENNRQMSTDDARAFAIAVLMKVGVPKPHAEIVADSLVEADLRGIETHGMIRLPEYVQRLRQGGVVAGVEPKIIHEKGPVIPSWTARTV